MLCYRQSGEFYRTDGQSSGKPPESELGASVLEVRELETNSSALREPSFNRGP